MTIDQSTTPADVTPDAIGLSAMLRPRSIAIIGASQDLTSLSGRPLDILLQHKFDGALYPVNPHRSEVAGLPTWPSIESVPERVDLAVIAVRAALVPGVLGECAAAGVRSAVIFTSGFAEEGDEGRMIQAEFGELARRSGMRILGPNAEGFFNLGDAIPVSFSPAVDYKRGLSRVQHGNLAIVSQSGGLGFAIFNWAQSAGLGASYVVTTGNESDLEILEFADFLVSDPDTKVIALIVEGFRNPECLGPVVTRAAQLGKRIVIGKLGRTAPGRRGALAHTAHDSGDDTMYQAWFERWDIITAGDQEELLDIAFALSRESIMTGRRVGILTSSGGAAVSLADACEDAALVVPEFDGAFQERLRPLMPSYGSPCNPVDVTAQVFGNGGLAPALAMLCESPEVDAVALVCSLASPHMLENERAELTAILAATDKPVLVYTYTNPAQASVELLSELGLAWYPSARRMARALGVLAHVGEMDAARGLER